MEKVNKKYAVLLGLLIVLWGSYAVCVKFILRDLDNFQMLFYLFLSGALCSILFQRKQMMASEKYTPKEWGVLAVASGSYFWYYFAYAFALRFIPTIEATMINYLFPIMVVVFAVLFFKEKLTVGKVIAMALGFVGVAIVATNGNLLGFTLSNPVGDLMAFSAACAWGIFSNCGKLMRKNYFLCDFIYIVVGMVLAFGSMMIFSEFRLPNLLSTLLLLWLGFSNLSFGLSLYFNLVRVLPTPVIANSTFLTPIVTIVFIIIFLGESFSVPQLFGAIMIFAGMLVQSGAFSWRKKNQ